jgi:uncharacterized integral membrane protein
VDLKFGLYMVLTLEADPKKKSKMKKIMWIVIGIIIVILLFIVWKFTTVQIKYGPPSPAAKYGPPFG